jgi:ketosteroid isomerase-like protein
MRVEQEVLAANQAFYDAFATRNIAVMGSLWAEHAPVTCIHPGWQPLRGREAVLASWRNILEGPNPPAIRCTAPSVHLLGESAFVICTERLPDAELVATNVFAREAGAWKLVHHHAGGVARPSEDSDDEPGLLH